MSDPMKPLEAADFEAFEGQTFQIHRPEGAPLEVELVRVERRAERVAPGAGARGPFSLLFRGPREVYLPQRIHTLEHAVMGALALFLVPIGPDEHGMRFEAVFN